MYSPYAIIDTANIESYKEIMKKITLEGNSMSEKNINQDEKTGLISVEFRKNGELNAYIRVNKLEFTYEAHGKQFTKHSYEYYNPGEKLVRSDVYHCLENGNEELINLILNDAKNHE